MSNVKRSRSPRYRREYSLSSLSSNSLGDIHRSSRSDEKLNKLVRDRRNGNQNTEANHLRKCSKKPTSHAKKSEHDGSKYKGYGGEKEKERGRYSKNDRAESPEEESYLKSGTSLYMERDGRAVVSEKDIHATKPYEFEELMQDPSTCNFQGAFHAENNFVSAYEDPKKVEERKKTQDETSSRLERLEKLVELLANNNKKPQSVPTTVSQEVISGVPEFIPRNSNFTTSMWLNRIEDECVERNFDEKTSIQFLQSKMTGIIKAWFKTVASYDFTWPELKMLIIQLFPDNDDFSSSLKLLVERIKKLDETIIQYYFCKMYLLEACKISGANAVSCLIDGLGNEMWKQEAKSYNFLTPEALYSQFLSKLADFKYDYHEQRDHELAEVYDIDERQIKLPERDFKQNYKSKRCYTCNKFGHITADCRHAPICYKCKNTGHIAVNCPLKM